MTAPLKLDLVNFNFTKKVLALIFFSIGNLPSAISLDPKYKNITLTGFEELKYGVLLTPSMLPSTLIFKPPENKFNTFSGGLKSLCRDC